ncbi:MAG: glycosyltransferase family 39 protein [Planctomycetes bacterium]|nr:glycosyltransferase family 39 protein [Planctomycetota bacterium]
MNPHPDPSAAVEPRPPWSAARRIALGVLLLGFYCSLSAYRLSDLPLVDPDEPRYAAAGRTMAEGGDWLIPEFNGQPRVNKPPLFYWLVALSARAFGPADEVTARLPSLFMGALMLFLTVYLGTRIYGDATGYLAGLILATTPLCWAISRTCVIDETFATLLCAAIACLMLGLTGRWPWRPNTSVLAAGVLAGLAFLAKGTATLIVFCVPLLFVLFFRFRSFYAQPVGRFWAPVWLGMGVLGVLWGLVAPLDPPGDLTGRFPAFVIAGPVMAAFCVIYYGLLDYWKPRHWIVALALFLVLGLWWYVYLWSYLGTQRFQEMVHYETAGRMRGNVHEELPVYYLYIMLGVFFPWSLALPAALIAAWRPANLPLPLESKAPSIATYRVADAFLVAWVLGVVLFFTVPAAKLAYYILPAMPAAALLTARLFTRLAGGCEAVGPRAKQALLFLVLLFAECLVVMAWSPAEEPPGRPPENPDRIWQLVLLIAACLGLIAAAYAAARAMIRTGEPTLRGILTGVLIAAAAANLAAWIVVPSRIVQLPNRWARVVEAAPVPLWTIAAVTGLCFCLPWAVAVLTRYVRPAAFAMAGVFAALVWGLVPIALPHVADRSNKVIVDDVGAWAQIVEKLYTVGCEEESLVYYLKRVVQEARRPKKGESRSQIVRELLDSEPPGKVLLFIHRRYYALFLDDIRPEGSRLLAHDDHIVVLLNQVGPDAEGLAPVKRKSKADSE